MEIVLIVEFVEKVVENSEVSGVRGGDCGSTAEKGW